MNLKSDIKHLLTEFPTTARVHNALTMYEGIQQVKDLINEDGSFVGGPRKLWIIPNIGKHSVMEIDEMRRWFVENHLPPQTLQKKDLWAWLDTCPTHEWDVVDIDGGCMRIIIPFDDPEEGES